MLIKFLLLLITLSSYTAIATELQDDAEKPLCTKEQCSSCNAKTCQCFCSVKCGPREIGPGDNPKFDEVEQKCFCAARDKRLYRKNGCALKQERQMPQ